MKLLESLTKRFTKTASEEVKREVKKSIIDLLPGVLTIGTMLLGIFVFHSVDGAGAEIAKEVGKAAVSTTRITTNNYFLGDVSEEIIKKVLEEGR